MFYYSLPLCILLVRIYVKICIKTRDCGHMICVWNWRVRFQWLKTPGRSSSIQGVVTRNTWLNLSKFPTFDLHLIGLTHISYKRCSYALVCTYTVKKFVAHINIRKFYDIRKCGRGFTDYWVCKKVPVGNCHARTIALG